MNNNTIVLTGGGTAGHVSLNEAIIPELIKKNTISIILVLIME